MVRLGLELTSSVGANRRENGEFALLGDNKKSFVTEGLIDAISGVIACRPRVDDAQAAGLAGLVRVFDGTTTRRCHGGSRKEKLSAVHISNAGTLSISKLEDQAREKAVDEFPARAVINREHITEPKPGLYRADGFEIEAESGIADEAVVAGGCLVDVCIAGQFKDRDELEHVRQREFLVLNGKAENKPVTRTFADPLPRRRRIAWSSQKGIGD